MAPVIAPKAIPTPLALGGELFSYAQGRVAFESATTASTGGGTGADRLLSSRPNKCILLGGLSDGLLPVPYTSLLQDMLSEIPNDDGGGCWSLVQPILSSSYTGFGHGSLDRDVEEMAELLEYLETHRNAQRFAMVGHSTGTQDIVHFLKHQYEHKNQNNKVDVVALQAPVSDRESSLLCHGCHETEADHLEQRQLNMQLATTMREEGKGDEMMPRSAFWAPITASRYLDLNEKGGADDYFSSDLSDEELVERLGHIGRCGGVWHCLVACSGSDEYVPDTVNTEQLMHRLCQAMNTNCSISSSGSTRSDDVAIPLYLPTGNHNLSSRDGRDAVVFVNKFKELLFQRKDA